MRDGWYINVNLALGISDSFVQRKRRTWHWVRFRVMHKKIFTNGNMKLNEFKKKKMKWRKNTKNVRNNINPYKRNLLSHRWKSLNSSPTIFVWKSKQGLKFSVSDMFMKFYAEWRPWYCPRETRFYKTACLKLSIRMYFHLWNRVLKIGWLHNLSMWVAGLQLARNFWSPCWKKMSMVEKIPIFYSFVSSALPVRNSYEPWLNLETYGPLTGGSTIYRYHIFHRYQALTKIFVSFA